MNSFAAVFFYPCSKIPDFTYDYLEDRLPFTTSLRFRAHLKMCEGCAEFVHLYRMAADPVKFLDENPAPPDLIERTLEFLDTELGKQGPDA